MYNIWKKTFENEVKHTHTYLKNQVFNSYIVRNTEIVQIFYFQSI